MARSSKSPVARATSIAPLSGSAGSAHTPATTVFNPDLALERCCGDPGLLQEMVACFLCEMEGLFPEMRLALRKGDLAKVGRLGHRMKGTVVYLGAEAAREAARAVEHFEEHPGQKAEAERAVNALEQQCELLKSVLTAKQPACPP